MLRGTSTTTQALPYRSRRRVPLRARVVEALLEAAPPTRGLVFPAQRGGYIDLHNSRSRVRISAMRALDFEPRPRIHDLRHTYATFSEAL
jgi:integrase